MNYLIVGDSSAELTYEHLLNKILTETPDIKQQYFDAALKEEELFFQSISINSMFGTKELIVLKRAEKIDKIWNFFKAMSNFNILNKDIIILYTSSINEFGKETKPFPKKARTAIEGNFQLIESFDKDGDSVVNYIKKRLNVDKNTAVKFGEMVGDDIAKLKQEIDKINLFLDGEKFSFDKVSSILTISKEFNTFDMVKDILSGKKGEALIHLKKSKEHPFFLNVLTNELTTLLKLNILKEEKKITFTRNYNTFKEEFEKNKELFQTKKGFSHPYAIFKKLPLTERFNSNILEKYLDKILEIEGKFKSGEGELEIMLETFILKI